MKNSTYQILIDSNRPTVVERYDKNKNNCINYQSEYELENLFVNQLIAQGYNYLDLNKINSNNHEQGLIDNLKYQLEKLNKCEFSANEWKRICDEHIFNKNDNQIDKIERFQSDYIFTFKRDDGNDINIKLIDKQNVHNNYLQVIRQYKTSNNNFENRYDVTILVNGLPLVHVELKRRGIPLEEAFNQIHRYKNESFSNSKGLFEYIQIFIISNGTDTKYFSNSNIPLKYDKPYTKNNSSKSGKNFKFTIYWSDQENNLIKDLVDFTKHFLSKHTILNILTKYCIFTTDKKLLIMRPYQITATEKIINQIEISHNYPDRLGKQNGGGFIWHTTGSGKTVTSFKTAQIATKLNFVKKVLFVVDRKDLDYQTMKEYDKFEKGAANSNKDTKILQRQLEDPNCKIIITTIQKLSNFVKLNKSHQIYKDHIVMIFDECHRSQFGDMHISISSKFTHSNLFGFTGTPIFADNAQSAIDSAYSIALNETKNPKRNNQKTEIYTTTEQLFGKCLHKYTIINAIEDNNVLKFKYSEIKTFDKKDKIKDKQIFGINTESIWTNPKRIANNVKYILDNFDAQTYRNQGLKNLIINRITNVNEIAKDKKQKTEIKRNNVHVSGFNSILATSSIGLAKLYYQEFKKQLENCDKKLNIAIIYSYPQNEKINDIDNNLIFDEDNTSIDGLDESSKQFLSSAIDDYNKLFETNYGINSSGFEDYYRDVSLRMKNMELDILIVVNMFLTGFDAPILNTLWVDKNLKMHGLMQAFSRTNRIFNSNKSFGNIVSFRPLKKELDEAIALFGGKDKNGILILREFNDYYNGYYDNNYHFIDGYKQNVQALLRKYPYDSKISIETNKKDFVRLFGKILKQRNILFSFDKFANNPESRIISDFDFQNYLSRYIEVHDDIKTNFESKKTNIEDDLIFETDLVKELDVDLDYIFDAILKNQDKFFEDKEICAYIKTLLNSSYELRSKRDLINEYLLQLYDNYVNKDEIPNIYSEYKTFIMNKEYDDLNKIIKKYNLDPDKTHDYMKNSFEIGELKEYGPEWMNIIPKTGKLFQSKVNISKSANRKTIEQDLRKHFYIFKYDVN